MRKSIRFGYVLRQTITILISHCKYSEFAKLRKNRCRSKEFLVCFALSVAFGQNSANVSVMKTNVTTRFIYGSNFKFYFRSSRCQTKKILQEKVDSFIFVTEVNDGKLDVCVKINNEYMDINGRLLRSVFKNL